MPSSPPPSARSGGPGRRPGYRVERSAGGVVVRVRAGGVHILLIRDPYGKWGLPKGHLEPDESPEDAAVREVREETGLEEVVLGPDLGEIDWTFRVRGRKVHKFCRFYLMASDRGEPRPERGEGISAVRWVPAGEAAGVVQYENARGVVRRALAHLPEAPAPEGNGVPWGNE